MRLSGTPITILVFSFGPFVLPAQAQDSHATGDSTQAQTNVARVGHLPYVGTQKPAKLLSNNGFKYPEILRRVGVEGEVRTQFVVDTFGKAEDSTLKIVAVTVDMSLMRQWGSRYSVSSDPDSTDEITARTAFIESAKRAIVNMTFSPAEVGGRRVRQLVELPFNFSMRH
jgi:outer membrane biosynthesis protein TonB